MFCFEKLMKSAKNNNLKKFLCNDIKNFFLAYAWKRIFKYLPTRHTDKRWNYNGWSM